MEDNNKKASEKTAVCPVCMHHCKTAPGGLGRCKARRNEDGVMVPINYGKVTSLALDPIEKKPLYRFHPKSLILSVGSFGCNLSCPFCQNYSISQTGEETESEYISPERLCEIAKRAAKDHGNIGVAFTYNEALVGYEYVRDAAKLIKEAGLYTVLVSNGTATTMVLDEILVYIDAMNIDLKVFNEEGYRWLGGDLATVKEWIKGSYEKTHLEVTSLIVPGLNDDEKKMDEMAGWLGSLSPKIPLHITRYFPGYMHTQGGPTPVDTLYKLKGVAEKHLEYVYVGNV